MTHQVFGVEQLLGSYQYASWRVVLAGCCLLPCYILLNGLCNVL